MNLADELCRHRILTNGPIGAWETCPGTHSSLFEGTIRFDDDGTGQLGTSSLMSGEEALKFEWRTVAYGVIECRSVYEPPELDDDGQPEVASWMRIPFVIQQHATEAGSFWALQEPDRASFWELGSPVVPVER